MPEWLPAVLLLVGVIVSASLGFLGAVLANKLTAKKHKNELQLALVDQLQEERDRLDAKIDKMNTRITGFYADKHASRRYIASLEEHINQRNPPPPPEPPPGYVP